MVALGPRPRELSVPTKREVDRRVRRTTGVVFVVFVVVGWAVMNVGSQMLNSALLSGLLGTALLFSYGTVLGYLLWQASRRELALVRTTSLFLEGLPVGVVFFDEKGAVTYVNPAISRLTGHSGTEAIGLGAVEFVAAVDRPRLLREFERVRTGGVAVFELQILRKDGAVLQTVITAIPFFDNDKFDGTLAVVSDITETLEARAQAVRYRELSSFALDVVTHDLSNRMQEVVSRAGIAGAALPAEAQRAGAALAKVADSAERAARLIKEVKQIAAAERENWPKRILEIPALVDKAIELADIPGPLGVEAEVRPEAAAKRVEASDLAPLVISKLLEQAAEGATLAKGGGKLLLAVSVEAASEPEALLRIHGFNRTVSDQDLRLMLASPRDPAGRELPWRSGVKLALAAAVAQAHGWGVRAVRDKEGKGVVFEVRIPMHEG